MSATKFELTLVEGLIKIAEARRELSRQNLAEILSTPPASRDNDRAKTLQERYRVAVALVEALEEERTAIRRELYNE